MPERLSANEQLARLRQWRTRQDRDVSMAFLPKQFKQEIERPFTQVRSVVDVWQQCVPEELAAHCRLDSLRRGVLKVAVSSSGHLYELDRMLRTGLAEKITRAHGGTLRKIQLVLRAE